MIVVMQPGASPQQVEYVIAVLSRHGFDVHRSSGEEQVVIGAIGVQPGFDARAVEALDGVAEVHRVSRGYRLASRLWKSEPTRVAVGATAFGGGAFGLIGVVRARPQEAFAAMQRESVLLGFTGCRTFPEAPGDAPAWPPSVARAEEVFDVADLKRDGAALFVVGPARMGHVALLDALGRQPRPVVLYRGAAATVEEWLMHADRILAGGSAPVMLCESGIRTFETTTHRTLDLSSIPAVQARSHLPILVDPGYGTGQPRKVAAMARAATAAGADGLILDVYPELAVEAANFSELMAQIRAVRTALSARVVP